MKGFIARPIFVLHKAPIIAEPIAIAVKRIRSLATKPANGIRIEPTIVPTIFVIV